MLVLLQQNPGEKAEAATGRGCSLRVNNQLITDSDRKS